MRYQISSPGYTQLRNKFNLGDQGVGGFSEAECKPQGPGDAAWVLRELYPTQKQIWIQK